MTTALTFRDCIELRTELCNLNATLIIGSETSLPAADNAAKNAVH